jgi:mannose-6-phosphate isomerase-like protein (cupin superfamily)
MIAPKHSRQLLIWIVDECHFVFLAGQEQKPYEVVLPNGGQPVHALPYPNGIYRIIVRGNQTANIYTIIEGLIYINEGARTHYHMKEDEMFYVVNGTLQFSVAGDQFCAPAGTTVYIPRNVTQSVRNINSKPAYVQILFTPPGRENYLDSVSPIYDTQPINYTRANELALEYGVVNLPAIDWKELNCVHNGNALFTLSFFLRFLTIQFYVIKLI